MILSLLIMYMGLYILSLDVYSGDKKKAAIRSGTIVAVAVLLMFTYAFFIR